MNCLYRGLSIINRSHLRADQWCLKLAAPARFYEPFGGRLILPNQGFHYDV